MDYQRLAERLAIAHADIERVLEQLLEHPLPPLPVTGRSDAWHRELHRIERIRECLVELAAARQASTGAERQTASRRSSRTER